MSVSAHDIKKSHGTRGVWCVPRIFLTGTFLANSEKELVSVQIHFDRTIYFRSISVSFNEYVTNLMTSTLSSFI